MLIFGKICNFFRGEQNTTKEEVYDVISRFLDDSLGEFEWDDFITSNHSDPVIQKIASYAASLSFFYPSKDPLAYCSEEGVTKLNDLLKKIQLNDADIVNWVFDQEKQNVENLRKDRCRKLS